MLWPLRKILPALEMLMRRSGILQLRKDLDFEPKNLDTNLHANNGVEQNPVYILFDLSLQAKATRRGPLPDVTTLLDKAGCPFSKVLRFIAWLFCKRETSYFPRPDHSSNLAWTSNKDDPVMDPVLRAPVSNAYTADDDEKDLVGHFSTDSRSVLLRLIFFFKFWLGGLCTSSYSVRYRGTHCKEETEKNPEIHSPPQNVYFETFQRFWHIRRRSGVKRSIH